MMKRIPFIAVTIIALFFGFYAHSSGKEVAFSVATAVALWMAGLWITEAWSIYLTSFIPLVVFPFLGVSSMSDLAPAYMPQIIFFFIGGFYMAFALEESGLHKRIAYWILSKCNGNTYLLLGGFMAVSYGLSIWILNTATVMMLLPALLAVLSEVKSAKPDLAKPYLLGLAFSASIGGTASVVGTAPNLYFMDFFNTTYPLSTPISFGNWMLYALPVSLVMLIAAFGVLAFQYRSSIEGGSFTSGFFKNELAKLGALNKVEKRVGAVWIVTVLAWFFRADIALGFTTIPGWSQLLPAGNFIKESTIAILAALVLFALPSGKQSATVLTWEVTSKVPFGVIFLFGGGFALAQVLTDTGVSSWLTEQLFFVKAIHPILLVLTLAGFMTFLTELTSNTASTVLVLPILSSITVLVDLPPLIVLMPVVLSASYAFMLPVATPPNALVFGAEKLSVKDMARAGIWLNLIGIAVVTVFGSLLSLMNS